MENPIFVNCNEIDKAIAFIRGHLDKEKISDKEKGKAVLMAEESLMQLFSHSPEGTRVSIRAVRVLGEVRFYLRAKGSAFDFFNRNFTDVTLGVDLEESAPDEDVIRSYLLNAYEDHLSYQNKKGINTVKIKAGKLRYRQLYMTLGGMVLGLLLGFLMKFLLSESIYNEMNEVVFCNVTSVFLNLLQTVVGPVVFFSIATSIAGFGDLTSTGRVGARILAMYLALSLVAIAIGIGFFYIFKPGNPDLIHAVSSSFTVDTSSVENTSVLDTILDIVPSNIVEPFLESNMLQIIFLAVVIGACAGLIGKYSSAVSSALETMNELFMKITMIFVRLVPLVALCSMASLVLSTGGSSILSIFYICIVVVLAQIGMGILYGILLLIKGINPFRFYRKYAHAMIQVMAVSSSNASIPLNMSVCDEKLGVSKKVYSLSIPLGATINMHGLCICITILTLSFAKIYGITITGAMLLNMIITIILIAMGTPGIPGTLFVVLAVIFKQVGIPVAAISLVVGVSSLLDMVGTAVNCLGDVTTTMIVAKDEHLLDMERFKA